MGDNNTFNNLNLVLQKDEGVSQQIQFNTTDANVGLKLNYDIDTANPKTFSITKSGINFTDSSNNQTTSLDRLAAVQQAFQAVELPPDADTLQINNRLLVTDGVDNIIVTKNAVVLDIGVTNLTTPYPTTYTGSSGGSAFTSVSNDVAVRHTNEFVVAKSQLSPITTSDLSSSVSTTSSSIPPVGVTNNSNTSVFPVGLQFIISNITTLSITIQDYSNTSTYTNVDLTSVNLDYNENVISYSLANVTIQQIIPVYYNSPTDCKFYIIFRITNGSQVYVMRCQGNPILLASYRYAPNFLTCGVSSAAAVTVSNGSTNLGLIPISSGSSFTNGIAFVTNYDEVNDYLVWGIRGATASTQSYAVTNVSLTGALNVVYNISAFSALTNLGCMRSTIGCQASVRLYNASVATNGALVFCNWNASTNTLSNSALKVVTGDLPGFNTVTTSASHNQDSFLLETTNAFYFYFTYIDNTDTSNRLLKLACYSWDKIADSVPVFVFSRTIENTGAVAIATTLGLYLSINIPNVPANASLYNIQNNTAIEIFSCITGNLYLSVDSLQTFTTTNLTASILTGFTFWTNPEQESNATGQMRNIIMYPQHLIMRCTGAVGPFTFNNIVSISVTATSPALLPPPTPYLSFDYNPDTSVGSVSSGQNMVYSANPLTLNAGSNSLVISGLATQTEYDRVNIKAGIVCKSTNYYAQYNSVSNNAVPNGSTTTVIFDSTVHEFGFTKPSNNIQFSGPGLYKIGVSLLITCTSGSSNNLYICLSIGAPTGVANTGRTVQLQSSSSPHLLYYEYYLRATGTENLAVVVGADNSNLALNTIAGATVGSFTFPSNPAAIITIQQIE